MSTRETLLLPPVKYEGRERPVMNHEINRSLDISEIMSRLHRQAVLVGGPHDGKRAPLPPVIYNEEHPAYLCQPGRFNDQTYYHYKLLSDTTYVYADHCDTLVDFPHSPAEQDDEQERVGRERLLFVAAATIICGASAVVMGTLIRYLVLLVA